MMHVCINDDARDNLTYVSVRADNHADIASLVDAPVKTSMIDIAEQLVVL